MDSSPDLPILVGITGRGENTAALRFAAEEAVRERCGIRLVHAVHQVLPPPPGNVLLSFDSLEHVAHRLVVEVTEELRDLSADSVDVEGVVRPGSPVHVLVELSHGARMVVLQHRARSGVRRIFTGSTSVAVAARAHCAVVSVPESWPPAERLERVTAGVDEFGGPGHVLQAAFSAAASRKVPLTVLHAWRLDLPYDDLVAADKGHDEWQQDSKRQLEDAVGEWAARYPTVRVDIQMRHQWSADALAELSTQSDLLVLGRHSGRVPVPAIGSIARTLISEAECPVQVVPAR